MMAFKERRIREGCRQDRKTIERWQKHEKQRRADCKGTKARTSGNKNRKMG